VWAIEGTKLEIGDPLVVELVGLSLAVLVPGLDPGLELDLETDLLGELFDLIELFGHELDLESVVELFQFQLYQLVEVKIDLLVDLVEPFDPVASLLLLQVKYFSFLVDVPNILILHLTFRRQQMKNVGPANICGCPHYETSHYDHWSG
jgi:hypothetical protein